MKINENIVSEMLILAQSIDTRTKYLENRCNEIEQSCHKAIQELKSKLETSIREGMIKLTAANNEKRLSCLDIAYQKTDWYNLFSF